jgi:hypothetical protein
MRPADSCASGVPSQGEGLSYLLPIDKRILAFALEHRTGPKEATNMMHDTHRSIRARAATAALALLVLGAPAASQTFKSKAEEKKPLREQALQKQAERDASKQERQVSGEVKRIGAGDDAEARSVAEKASHYEKVHRERMARIHRLESVYKAKGDETKVAELQAMASGLEKRHANAMKGFREQLGDERWAKVEKHWRGPSARALEVRNERANENAAARDARKASKEGDVSPEKRGKPAEGARDEKKPAEERPKADKPPRSKEKPPGRNGR